MEYLLTERDNTYKVTVMLEENRADPIKDLDNGDVKILVDTDFYKSSNCDSARDWAEFFLNFEKIFNIRGKTPLIENLGNFINTVQEESKEAGYLCLPIRGRKIPRKRCFVACEFNPYKWHSRICGFAWKLNTSDARKQSELLGYK